MNYKYDGILKLIFVGILLFSLNQGLEFLILKFHQKSYMDLCLWDCGWYRTIVEEGYDLEPHRHLKMDAANWTFFPLFPLIVKGFTMVTNINSSLALIIVSKFFFLLSIIAFMIFAKKYLPETKIEVAGLVVAMHPYSIYANSGYTESLFLFLTCTFFCLLKEKRYLQAGLAGAFLGATRFVGISASLSYAISIILCFFKNKRKPTLEAVLGILLVPLGLALFMTYLFNLTGDALAFVHVHRAWDKLPDFPWNNIIRGLLEDSPLVKYWALVAIFAIICSFYLLIKKQYELSIFSFSCTILSISNTSLTSCPRYIFWQAPILLVITSLCKSPKVFWLVIIIFLIMQLILYNGWFSGNSWVV